MKQAEPNQLNKDRDIKNINVCPAYMPGSWDIHKPTKWTISIINMEVMTSKID
jgi:hypothetical protein